MLHNHLLYPAIMHVLGHGFIPLNGTLLWFLPVYSRPHLLDALANIHYSHLVWGLGFRPLPITTTVTWFAERRSSGYNIREYGRIRSLQNPGFETGSGNSVYKVWGLGHRISRYIEISGLNCCDIVDRFSRFGGAIQTSWWSNSLDFGMEGAFTSPFSLPIAKNSNSPWTQEQRHKAGFCSETSATYQEIRGHSHRGWGPKRTFLDHVQVTGPVHSSGSRDSPVPTCAGRRT
jgi:hypothetical protein